MTSSTVLRDGPCLQASRRIASPLFISVKSTKKRKLNFSRTRRHDRRNTKVFITLTFPSEIIYTYTLDELIEWKPTYIEASSREYFLFFIEWFKYMKYDYIYLSWILTLEHEKCQTVQTCLSLFFSCRFSLIRLSPFFSFFSVTSLPSLSHFLTFWSHEYGIRLQIETAR